jgi:hypothetical protein
LLNKEDKKEVFFGVQKLLADDGFYTVIRHLRMYARIALVS